MEKTGYPKDMLDLDLDLEADLGVDTVKQAEMFAAIREIYNIPRDENRKLRDYPTLAHVIRFVYREAARPGRRALRRSQLPAAAAAASVETIAPTPSVAAALPSPDEPDDPLKRRCWRLLPRRLAIPRTCWTWTSISKPISASTPSNRRRCLPRCVRRTTFRAMRSLKLRDFPTLAHVIEFAQTVGRRGVAQADCDSGAKSQPSSFVADRSSSATPSCRQLRRGQPHSAPRAGTQSAAAAQPLQANGRDAGSGQPRGHHAGQRRRGRRAGQRLQTMGVEVLRLNAAPDADALTSASRLAGYWSGARRVLAARAGQRGPAQRHGR